MNRHTILVRTVLFGSIIGLLLFAQTAFWLNRTMFNTDNFTEITTTAVTSESSRNSVSQAIVNRLFEDRPVLNSTVGPKLVNLIAGLLGTDQAQRLIEKVVEQAQITVTTPRREPIVLDLTGIKATITKLQAVIDVPEEERKVDVAALPDEITVIDTTKIPNVYETSVAVLWLGPLCLILAISLMGYWLYRGAPSVRLLRFRILLTLLIASAFIALLIGPLARPPFLSVAENAQTQTLLGNLYDGFMAPFIAQAKTLGIFALLVLGVTYVYKPVAAQVSKLTVSKKQAKTTATSTSKPKSKSTKTTRKAK